ncbi:MAG: DNA repair protein RadC [Magnetococcales bacterium]|nr:DNA repair protein RadC [Magnetococcales bacterium]
MANGRQPDGGPERVSDSGGACHKDLHAGHRTRLRQRFLREGLERFEPHQTLELLLFYALPRRDTNAIAHLLMQRFGSLSAILEADPKDLAQIEGMGEKAATFLSLIPALTRLYLQDRVLRDKPPLNNLEMTNNYLVPLMAGRTEEVFYVLCLDARCRLIFPALITKGTVQEAYIHPRHVVEAALRHKASQVILAHNHPSGSLLPSREDRTLTQMIQQAMIPIGINVLDHIIVAGNDTFSFARNRMLEEP